MACTSMWEFSPNFIIEPAPKSRSICVIAVLRACALPAESSPAGTANFVFFVDAIICSFHAAKSLAAFLLFYCPYYTPFLDACQYLFEIYFSVFGILSGILLFLDNFKGFNFPKQSKQKDAGELFEKSSPTPPQKLSHNDYLNKFVSFETDRRRERKVRFGFRKLAG